VLNETIVTLQGHVGGEVTLRQAGETPVLNVRVACTPRRFNRRSGEWSDGDTQWYTVTCWRTLAEHCAQSLRSGDPVVVHGRLVARTFVNKSGVEQTVHDVEAVLVGHDLTRGTSRFERTQRASPAPAVTDAPTPTDVASPPDGVEVAA